MARAASVVAHSSSTSCFALQEPRTSQSPLRRASFAPLRKKTPSIASLKACALLSSASSSSWRGSVHLGQLLAARTGVCVCVVGGGGWVFTKKFQSVWNLRDWDRESWLCTHLYYSVLSILGFLSFRWKILPYPTHQLALLGCWGYGFPCFHVTTHLLGIEWERMLCYESVCQSFQVSLIVVCLLLG
jgi:hypothetical protein